MVKSSKMRVCITMTRERYKWLCKRAEIEDLTLSQLINRIINKKEPKLEIPSNLKTEDNYPLISPETIPPKGCYNDGKYIIAQDGHKMTYNELMEAYKKDEQ